MTNNINADLDIRTLMANAIMDAADIRTYSAAYGATFIAIGPATSDARNAILDAFDDVIFEEQS